MMRLKNACVVILILAVIVSLFSITACSKGAGKAKVLPAGFEYIEIEAENGIENKGLWQIKDSETASGLKFIVTDAPKVKPDPLPDGSIKYAFTITKAGEYRIFARYRAKDEKKNSFYYDVDSTKVLKGDFESPVTTWSWGLFNYDDKEKDVKDIVFTVNFEAGEHSFILHHREPTVEVDKFVITDNATLTVNDLQ